MKKRNFKQSASEPQYVSPSMKTLSLRPEGVLCASGADYADEGRAGNTIEFDFYDEF